MSRRGKDLWRPWPEIVIGDPIPDFEARRITSEFDDRLYRPDTVADGWSNGRLVVRGASVRGYQHRYDGYPRQDDFALGSSEDGSCIFAALADGLSSAEQSHIGASYATRYAVRWLKQTVRARLETTTAEKIDWHQMLNDCMRSASWFLHEETKKLFGSEDGSRSTHPTATTLVCVVVLTREDDTTEAYSVSVGDSGVWQLSEGDFIPISGGKAANKDGIVDSSVSAFLPDCIPETFDTGRHRLTPDTVLLLGSDGFGDPLDNGQGSVGDMFRRALESRIPSHHEFAHLLDFSRETFDDDRTLIGIWLKPDEQATPKRKAAERSGLAAQTDQAISIHTPRSTRTRGRRQQASALENPRQEHGDPQQQRTTVSEESPVPPPKEPSSSRRSLETPRTPRRSGGFKASRGDSTRRSESDRRKSWSLPSLLVIGLLIAVGIFGVFSLLKGPGEDTEPGSAGAGDSSASGSDASPTLPSVANSTASLTFSAVESGAAKLKLQLKGYNNDWWVKHGLPGEVDGQNAEGDCVAVQGDTFQISDRPESGSVYAAYSQAGCEGNRIAQFTYYE